jgi:hypothetical protein
MLHSPAPTHPCWIAACLALLALAPGGQTNATLRVEAVPAMGLRGLAGATVTLDGTRRGETNAAGVLVVGGLRPGTHRLEISLHDHVPRGFRLRLQPGEERELTAVLSPFSSALPGVTASARRRSGSWAIESFYRRAQTHVNGRFVTRAQIDQFSPVLFTDLFRAMPGVQLIPTPGGWVVSSARAAGLVRPDVSGSPDSTGCTPAYYVDGVPYHILGSPDSELSVPEVEGIEVYMGIVPPQWGGSGAMCGVVVVWTRPRGGRR